MSLSNKTFQKLAEALTPEVIDYINQDERYVLFMQEIIPDALQDKLGQIDDDLKCELSMYIMDYMCFRICFLSLKHSLLTIPSEN